MILKNACALGLALGLAMPGVASANDSSIGDDNTTIVFKQQPEISMDRELLSISEEQVRVDYIFTNTGTRDLTVPIAFPMPPRYYGYQDHTEISNFKLWVNGHAVKTERKLVVLLDHKEDVTQKIVQLGWSAESLGDYFSSEFDKGSKPKKAKSLPKGWLGDSYDDSRLSINEYFIWQQVFPAGKPVSISHAYTPSVTTGVPYPAAGVIEEWKEKSCLDKDAQAGIRKREKRGGVDWAGVSYILTTGNNWQGPIKDFTLILKKKTPADVVSLCLEGDFVKTDPLTLSFHQSNFVPKNDLTVLYVRKADWDE